MIRNDGQLIMILLWSVMERTPNMDASCGAEFTKHDSCSWTSEIFTALAAFVVCCNSLRLRCLSWRHYWFLVDSIIQPTAFGEPKESLARGIVISISFKFYLRTWSVIEISCLLTRMSKNLSLPMSRIALPFVHREYRKHSTYMTS